MWPVAYAACQLSPGFQDLGLKMSRWGPSVVFSSWVPVLLWVSCLVTVGVYEQDLVVLLDKSFKSLSKQPFPTLRLLHVTYEVLQYYS